VLIVAAFEPRDPVELVVLVKTHDTPVHGRDFGTLAEHLIGTVHDSFERHHPECSCQQIQAFRSTLRSRMPGSFRRKVSSKVVIGSSFVILFRPVSLSLSERILSICIVQSMSGAGRSGSPLAPTK